MTWKQITLGEILRVKHGWAFKSEHFSDVGQHIVLTPGNFYEEGGFKARGDKDRFYSGDYPSEYLLSKGNVIVAMTEQGEGLLGSAAIIPENDRYLHNQRLGLVTIKNDAEADLFFVYKLFNTQIVRQQISGSASGAKVKHTAPERIYKCMVELPPLHLQKKIATILSAYDDLIENNLKRIKLLEEMAQITYEEWFVRLKFHGHETMPLDSATGLPVGWGRRSLLSVAEFLNGYAFKPEDLGENGYPVIKIKELKNGVDASTPRNDGKHIPAKYIVNEGDILFSWSASLEVIIWQNETGLLNQHLFKVIPNREVEKSFLYLALKECLPIFDNLTTGATMKHIKRKELDFVKIIVPDKSILTQFDSYASSIFQSILNLNSQNRFLKEARDILLPRLMTGMIDVEQLVLPELFNHPSASMQEPQSL